MISNEIIALYYRSDDRGIEINVLHIVRKVSGIVSCFATPNHYGVMLVTTAFELRIIAPL